MASTGRPSSEQDQMIWLKGITVVATRVCTGGSTMVGSFRHILRARLCLDGAGPCWGCYRTLFPRGVVTGILFQENTISSGFSKITMEDEHTIICQVPIPEQLCSTDSISSLPPLGWLETQGVLKKEQSLNRVEHRVCNCAWLLCKGCKRSKAFCNFTTQGPITNQT